MSFKKMEKSCCGTLSLPHSRWGEEKRIERISWQSKLTFGMIVLNGEPFLRYNFTFSYPFAHQIIVFEVHVLRCCLLRRRLPLHRWHTGNSKTLSILKTPKTRIFIVTACDEDYWRIWPGKMKCLKPMPSCHRKLPLAGRFWRIYHEIQSLDW